MWRFHRQTFAQRQSSGQRPVITSASSGPIRYGAMLYAASAAARPKAPGLIGFGNSLGTLETKGVGSRSLGAP